MIALSALQAALGNFAWHSLYFVRSCLSISADLIGVVVVGSQRSDQGLSAV